MSELDEFDALAPGATEEAVISEAASVIDSSMLGELREQAIERGRLYGEHEANRRGDTGEEREQRILWATAYSAWEFDGKPTENDQRYRKEFGLSAPAVTDQADRAPFKLLHDTEKAAKKK